MAAAMQEFCLAKRAIDFDEASCLSTSVGDEVLSLEEVSSQPSLKTARTSCTLVWCHERCHKPESDAARDTLGDAASLVCLKKANKFANWCQSRSEGHPYVLLTDWREVKPCRAYLASMPERQPLLTIVLCDDPDAKVFTRALAWARTLRPEEGMIHVVQNLEAVLDVLSSVRCMDGLGSPSSSRCSSKQAPMETVRPTQVVLQQPLLLVAPAVYESPAPVATTVRPPTATTGLWVQQVLAPFGNLNALQVEQLLHASAPSTYED